VLGAAKCLRAGTVVVHSAGGSFAVGDGEVVERPAFRVEETDAVGAGDAFVAGFLSGRLRGWDLGGCLELANACGACAVTVPGDAQSMPFEREALALVHGERAAER
jgi:2-dehydro-3-deoxygluconokinase